MPVENSFNCHGKVDFSWSNATLRVNVRGPFNEAGILRAVEEYTLATENPPMTPFSIIETWDAETLGSPEEFEHVRNFWNSLANKGCSKIALVAPKSLQRSIANKLLPNLGKAFESDELAINWIQSA